MEELLFERDLAHTKATARAAVRRPGLQRPLVLAAPLCARRRSWTRRQRRSPATARVQAAIAARARSVGRQVHRSRSTTTRWRPTRRATPSSTAPQPGSSTSGRCRPRRGGGRLERSRDSRGVTIRCGQAAFRAACTPPSSTFTASLAVDRRLLPYDLRASAVHVRMLARQGLIEDELAARICEALRAVEVEPDAADEDVHSAIERLLGRPRAGACTPAAAATTRCRRRCGCGPRTPATRPSSPSAALAGALLDRARGRRRPGAARATRTASVRSRCGWGITWPPTPGRSRATCGGSRAVRDAADVCPLGAGALAGSSLPLDPAGWRAELGFARSFDNSLDAVADRDYVSGLVLRVGALLRAPVAARPRSWCCGRPPSTGSRSSTTAPPPAAR